MSDENKLQIKDFLNDMKAFMLETIKTNRGLAPEQVNTIMNEYGGEGLLKGLWKINLLINFVTEVQLMK
ncbi:MAG: hypothetical protein IPN10_18235 [Saprospiraceae bacterium]|nr:hypothetical protein [Saprospiraceae bacterium]